MNNLSARPGFPRFGESFRYPYAEQIKLDQPNARIFLPKLGWMRLRLSRPVLGEVRSAKGTPDAPGKNVKAKSGLYLTGI